MDIDISLNKNNMEDLLVMLSGFNKESTDSSFEKIAKTLFGDYHIQKGTKTYELMEIEFYLFSERHKDIITYPRKNDKAGMWFFHMSGVDITFGTTDKNVYGGILIRSIIRTDEDEIYPISGPMKCVEELFDYIHAVDGDVKNDIPRIVKNAKDYNKKAPYVNIEKAMKYIPRFIPFRLKKNENIEGKIESKLSDLIRRREVPLNISEFKDFLKAKYRYYIESDEKYWSCKYSACPLESKRGSNDNKYLYL